MSDTTKLERIRELVRAKMLEVPSFSGEEMTLPQSDPGRDAFIEGERTVAAQVLALLDEGEPEEKPRPEDHRLHPDALMASTIAG